MSGSGTGIGREIALHFAREGADVVLHYAHSAAGAESAVEEIKSMGRKAAAFKADFSSATEPVALAKQAIELLGGIDCLVNNAGITFNRPFTKVTGEQFDLIYNVNVRGAVPVDSGRGGRHVHARRRGGVQHHLDTRRAGRARAFGLRRHQGRDYCPSPIAVGRVGPQRRAN